MSQIQPAPTTRTRSYDVERVREAFPVLHQEVHGQPLTYLDNAASTQKPRAVVDRIRTYYEREHANIHRGVHSLSQRATDAYEEARGRIAAFINSPDAESVIFTRGTTESINVVAASFGRTVVGRGDEVVLTALEHHSNIVPWHMLCRQQGARLRVVPVTDEGEVRLEDFIETLSDRTRLVAVSHISNALGTVNPVDAFVEEAHSRGIPVLIDGAQAVPHQRVDVQELDCDFYCFSGHKMYGPTGVGVLYGRRSLLEEMPPYQGGGDMIERVTFDEVTFNDLPYKFEAGTPNIAGGIGLAAAATFVDDIGMDAIASHEHEVLAYATERLSEIDGVRLIGTAPKKASVLSFLIGDVHPYDAGTILDRLGVAVRTGHHCTQPLMQRYGISGTIRASFAMYNTLEEVDRLAEGIVRVRRMFEG